MKIYLLTRKDRIGYDEYDSKVVVAKTAKRARDLANEEQGDEGNVWINPKIVICKQVKMIEGIVLSSFNNAK